MLKLERSQKQSFRLDQSLSEDSLANLRENGLDEVARDATAQLTKHRSGMGKKLDEEDKKSLADLDESIRGQHDIILDALRREVIEVIVGNFE